MYRRVKTRPVVIALALAVASASSAGRARAQEAFLLTADLGAAVPLTTPQRDRFGVGVAGGVGVYRSLAPFVLLGARLSAGFLSDGAAPEDTTLADPGIGGFATLALAARLRVPGVGDPASRASGPFVEVLGGASLTGSDVRPSVEVGIGWGFLVGALVIAPTVRYLHVMALEQPLSPGDAGLLIVGAELTFLDPRSAPSTTTVVDPTSDARDDCPDEPEDDDGFEDADGCPDLDDDRDGIPDTADACPREPEDVDGFEDTDGCPELDNDHDHILDTSDACPNEPEVVNAVDDEDGCPDQGVIELVDERIVLEETVLFDFDRARVKDSARPILAAIVRLYQQQGDWERVRIEGHADVRGDEHHNVVLSTRRSLAVKQVLGVLGMPREMMETAGYGASRPRAQGTTREAHQLNRRVEFVVVTRRGAESEPR